MSSLHRFGFISLILLSGLLVFGSLSEKLPPINPGPENDYATEWKRVDSLEKKGLHKSALEIVEQIKEEARSQNNQPQWIKSLIHTVKFNSYLKEDSFEESIAEFEKDITDMASPGKQVLHSVTGELYWMYYQSNRYKFLDRTTTIAFEPDDIKTWDLNQLIKRVNSHYEKSLSTSNELKNTKAHVFDAIIEKGDSSGRALRPTLYDLLAHRAIDFYSSSESGLTQPVYAFMMEDPEHFAPVEKFTELTFESRDSFSFARTALTIYQDLLSFRLEENDLDALVDADLKRLAFVYAKTTLSEKDSLYRTALENLLRKYENQPVEAEIIHYLARHLIQIAEKNPEEKLRTKALSLCRSVTEKYPDSYGAGHCINLIKEILDKSLSVQVEKVVVPEEYFPISVTYKNTSTTYLKLVRTEEMPWDSEGENTEDLLKAKTAEGFQFPLPLADDYNELSTEIPLKGLSPGRYALLASFDPSFDTKDSGVAVTRFQVSEVSFFTTDFVGQSLRVDIRDRVTGKPIKNAVVRKWIEKYDYSTRDYIYEKSGLFQTNSDGFVTLPGKKEQRNFYLEVQHQQKSVFSDSPIYQYYGRNGQEKPSVRTWFFTDRSIYRPGQTVNFKGLVIETTGDESKILTGRNSTVTLYDVNYQKVTELKVKTNEYGTFSGSFTLPSSGLNGNMQISDKNGQVYFSVEEYKRPRFEVKMNPVKGSYKLGEEVTITGKAESYSGSNISESKVSYRVYRTATFPFWRGFGRSYFPYSEEMEISHGTVVTDENGVFSITFPAVPDKSISKEFDPVFHYTVSVEVTDVGGETRTATGKVSAGYKSLILSSGIGLTINSKDPDSLKISAFNLNDQPQKVDVEVRIYSKKEPVKVLREKLWEVPDTQWLSREEYSKLLPLDPYKDENDPKNWEKNELVFSSRITTGEDPIRLLPEVFKSGKQGAYLLELTATDSFGEKVTKQSHYIQFNPESNDMVVPVSLWFQSLTSSAQPGETANFMIGSGWKDVQILMETEKKGKIISKEWIKLSNEQKKIELAVKEVHKGNFTVHFSFIRHNRVYTFSATISVPYEERKLEIELMTFRDKLLPGEQEEWTLNVKKKTGEIVDAEMVATLYDASLDAFRPHSLPFSVWSDDYSQLNRNSHISFGVNQTYFDRQEYERSYYPERRYDAISWFGFNYYYGGRFYSMDANMAMEQSEVIEEIAKMPARSPEAVAVANGGVFSQDEERGVVRGSRSGSTGDMSEKEVGYNGVDKNEALSQVQPRENLNETAFFYPHLKTDDKGNITIRFTIPEALTRWNFKGLAHTKDLSYGRIERSVVTSKELMVTPNLPRFIRSGDTLLITARVSNLSDSILNIESDIRILDPVSLKAVSGIQITPLTINGKIKPGGNTAVSWKLIVTDDVPDAIAIAITGKGGNHTDGEQQVIPILPSRVLVTESLPLYINGNSTKDFRFESLLASGKSKSLQHHQVTIEFTSNPAWYVVQALPYLMEYPYDCSEQIFNRYYANTFASGIVNQSPKIRAVINQWKNYEPSALLSALEKNEDLKQILLTETPWVLQAQDETERKKRIAVLFDLNRMSAELNATLNKLKQAQSPNGGFPWFKGMPDDRYITQYIVTGYGHLKRLGFETMDEQLTPSILRAITYLDARIAEDYDALIEDKADLKKDHLSHIQIQYLYARSFFLDEPVPEATQKAFDYYTSQATKFWTAKNKYAQGMLALYFFRTGNQVLSKDILKSLSETAIRSEELGMYWKDYNQAGYYWYQAPIETQSLLIEAFNDITKDTETVNQLKLWLLKNKQTNNWRTTKATADACYAILVTGTDWLTTEPDVTIHAGPIVIDPTTPEIKTEAGTGYFRVNFDKDAVTPGMGKVKVTKSGPSPGWGAVYWQYFELPEKVSASGGPLSVTKELFVEKPGDRGPVIVPVTKAGEIKPGDKIIVRLVIKSDRRMEYVHLKDQRGSGLEPENVISRTKYQDGLYYYESTKDASTDFFFNNISRGTYVFEYPLRVTHSGSFSTGMATIQCMYAPEFAAHSKGSRLR